MIEIRPARARLQAFARWAVAQNPKVRTVGVGVFGVPTDLFTHMPEHVLIGSQVDGHDYVSPELTGGFTEPHTSATGPDPEIVAGGELTGVARAEGFAAADPMPETGNDDGEQQERGAAPRFTCPDCDRRFKSERGRDTHRRHAHEG